MVSTTGLPSGAALATAKKAAAAKAAAAAKKPRAKPIHPRTSDMVDAAIKALKERGGSSLQAIKKYITATYKVDAEKLSPFIKKYLKSGVVAKKLVQTKGKGATGSFKLSVADKSGAKIVKAVKKSPAVKVKKSPAKKSKTIVKKAAVKKVQAVKKSPVKPKKAASPKKKAAPKSVAAKPPKPKVSRKAPAKARRTVAARK